MCFRKLKKTQPGRTCLSAARPGMWDQLSNRITASQRMLRSKLRQRPSSQRRPSRRRLKQRNPQARRPEESYQQPGQEPRSCCRRHSTRMRRQKRLEQVWSSSIDTPEILRIKILGRACFWAFTHMSAAILECFASFSYLFRDSRSAFNALESRVGLSAYFRQPGANGSGCERNQSR
jgi:hypothetical protein